jgi:hypothetical protein
MSRPTVVSLRARLARATREHGADAPETLEAREAYEAAKAISDFETRIGPLTASQRDTLGSLITSMRGRRS